MSARGEVPLELQGVQRLSARSLAPHCKECGGSQICEHGRVRSHARSAVGCNLRARSSSALSARSAVVHQSASTVVSALHARSAVGHKSASTVVSALHARSAVGASICEHGRRRTTCKECGGVSNLRARSSALSVQGVRWVINLRARSYSAMCARSAVGHQSASTVVGALHARSAVGHNLRARSLALSCKECGGSQICEHGRLRYRCKECRAVNAEAS